ncbi:MAG: PDDEXK nuclease domain-containing protein [Bacteroidia bacterium]|nr:PDDEXK nuclease domain-containing protein [Bacteroidia bacterium]MCF8425432.1 PDDEXK nuclease domain-containing protein [Bacteroidia bacterium]MCF8447218.1 PDDEXK nuclease domain-containing protein [Bacteroidia bacterium]
MSERQEFLTIISLIKQARIQSIRAVNTELINLYWNIGSYLDHQLKNAKWGEKTVDELADFIKKSHPELKGFNRRGLYRMKQFYQTYADSLIVSSPMTQLQPIGYKGHKIVSSPMTQFPLSDIRSTILTKISWTNHLAIFGKCKSPEERPFYLNLCSKENYSVKEQERQINSSSFERTLLGNSRLGNLPEDILAISEKVFKENYVFEFLNLPEPYSEKDLQKELTKQMKNFLLELGKDFLFLDQEFRLQVGNKDYRIDLLFYHRNLQCLVAIELKTVDFEPEHLGKLNFYLEALDRDIRKPHENPSIGILLCKSKDDEVVEYAMSRNISPALISQYTIALPNKQLLQAKLNELYEIFEREIQE